MTAEATNVHELITALRGQDARRQALEAQAKAAEERARQARNCIADAAADGRNYAHLLEAAARAESEAAALRAAIDGLAGRRTRLEQDLRAALPALFESEARRRLDEARKIEREAQPLLRKLGELLECELPITTLYTQHARLRDPELLGRSLQDSDLESHDPSAIRPYRLRREAERLQSAAHSVTHGYNWENLLRRIVAGADPVEAALRL